jgi:exodeoxyribonuclease VII small subunit
MGVSGKVGRRKAEVDMADDKELSFEQALAAVEKIVHELEEGKVGLSQSLQKYEEGVKLLRQCYGLLEGAERKIELLTGLDAQGNPVTTPYKDQSTLEAHKQGETRSKSRTWQPPSSEGSDSPDADRPGVDDCGGVM